MPESIYWDKTGVLSYNRVFSFVIGARGVGKTYGMKEWCIDDWLKNKNQFLYVRRYKTEMKRLKNFFDDISDKYPGHELKVKGNTAYCDDQPFGYFMALSTSRNEKSTAFPRVTKVIFDEFIIDKGMVHYITNEVELFLELFSTVVRLREDCRAVFLANAISVVNPYFIYFKTYPKPGKRFTATDNIVIENVQNSAFVEKASNTPFGKLIAGTPYGNYAISNEFLRDDKTFIEQKTEKARYQFGLKYNGRTYGVWYDQNEGIFYLSKKLGDPTYAVFNLTLKDGQPNMVYIKALPKNRTMKLLLLAFGFAQVRFDCQETKQAGFEMYEIMKG